MHKRTRDGLHKSIIRLTIEGNSAAAISRKLGCGTTTVVRARRKYKNARVIGASVVEAKAVAEVAMELAQDSTSDLGFADKLRAEILKQEIVKTKLITKILDNLLTGSGGLDADKALYSVLGYLAKIDGGK